MRIDLSIIPAVAFISVKIDFYAVFTVSVCLLELQLNTPSEHSQVQI